MARHIHIFAAHFKQQALQKRRLRPALPDAHIRAATLEVVTVRSYGFATPGLTIGQDKTGEPAPGGDHSVHRRVKAGHCFGFDNDVTHLSPPVS